MAPTHPRNIAFEFKVRRQTPLVIGYVLDFTLANMSSLLQVAIKSLLQQI